MTIWVNNGLLHPWRALTIALRRLLVNRAHGDPVWDGGDVPEALRAFTIGESLPWKGVRFKVGKIIGGDFPMLILIPVDRTRGAKLMVMRQFRTRVREVRKAKADVRL